LQPQTSCNTSVTASHSIKAQLIPVTSAIAVTGMTIAVDVTTEAHETDVVSR